MGAGYVRIRQQSSHNRRCLLFMSRIPVAVEEDNCDSLNAISRKRNSSGIH